MGGTDVQEATGEECSICTLYGPVQEPHRSARSQAIIPKFKGPRGLLPCGHSEPEPYEESESTADSNASNQTRCSEAKAGGLQELVKERKVLQEG